MMNRILIKEKIKKDMEIEMKLKAIKEILKII